MSVKSLIIDIIDYVTSIHVNPHIQQKHKEQDTMGTMDAHAALRTARLKIFYTLPVSILMADILTNTNHIVYIIIYAT